jgi:hypothetical protein
MPADVLDLETERIAKGVSEMDDETLLFVMLGLLEIETHTETSGICGRIAFCEIAARWIPPEVFGAAFRQIQEGVDAR